jgi:copper chaperone
MIEFTLPAMSCGHCVGVITETVRTVDPAAQVEADLERKTVRIETQGERANLVAALSEAGYPPA